MSQQNWQSWLNLARDDFSWGLDTLQHNHYPQACFIAQQVAEKALNMASLIPKKVEEALS